MGAICVFLNMNLLIPLDISRRINPYTTDQHRTLIQCFSLLLLGMFLATLATLNFSLSLFVGLLATPLSFLGKASYIPKGEDGALSQKQKLVSTAVLQIMSPPVVLCLVSLLSKSSVTALLAEAAFGWKVNGMWTQVVIWCIWWPAWLVGSVLVCPFT